MSSTPKLPVGSLSRAVAEVLREEVQAVGLSQKALGEAAGISQSQVSKYLRAERAVSIEELYALCLALGLDIAEVVQTAVGARGRGL